MKNGTRYLLIHAFFILSCLSLAASAVSVEFPDTPAGHRAKEFVSLLSGEFSRPLENLTVGYTNMNRNDAEGTGYRWDNTYMMPPKGTPAGGGYSTAEDLLKYSQALRNHRLLSKPYTDYFLNRFNGKPGDPYVPKGMYRVVGGAPGINADLAIDFVTGYTFIVLSNYDHPTAVNLAQEIVKMYGLN